MGEGVTILSAMTQVFTAVFAWLMEAIPSVVGIFYVAETGLTLLGVLAIVALAISLFFLVMGLIQNFLHLRG